MSAASRDSASPHGLERSCSSNALIADEDLSAVGRALNFTPGANRLISAFLVAGIAPKEAATHQYKALQLPPSARDTAPAPAPKILYTAFPENAESTELPPNILQFCFPNGCATPIEFVNDPLSSRKRQKQNMDDILVRPQHENMNPFTFLISGDKEPTFGLAFYRTEFAVFPPSFYIPPEEKMMLAPLRNSTFPKAPYAITKRCYCVLSKYALLPLLKQFLTGLVNADFLYSNEIRHGISNAVYSNSPIPVQVFEKVDKIVPPPALAKAIFRFCTTTLNAPSPGETLTYKLPTLSNLVKTQKELQFRCPPGDDPRQSAMNIMLEWSLHTLFQYLSLENIIRITTALLCERSVLFFCDDLHVLTNIILSTLPLLRPLSWQGIFIPLLPTNIPDVIDAPVPYIIGVPQIPGGNDRVIEGVIVMDIINDRFHNYGPELPQTYRAATFAENLRSYHKMLYSRSIFSRPAELGVAGRVRVVHALAGKLYEYIDWCVGLVRKHYDYQVKKNGNERITFKHMKDSFLANIHPVDKEFFKGFVESQQFAYYFHRHMSLIPDPQEEFMKEHPLSHSQGVPHIKIPTTTKAVDETPSPETKSSPQSIVTHVQTPAPIMEEEVRTPIPITPPITPQNTHETEDEDEQEGEAAPAEEEAAPAEEVEVVAVEAKEPEANADESV